MPTVLITGAAGFLGRYVAREMHAHDWRVVGIDRSPRPKPDPAAAGMIAHYAMQLPSDDISGVVAELGGSTSHLASLARERGIPMVLGVLNATQNIPDGAQVAVDGVAGVVRWMEK